MSATEFNAEIERQRMVLWQEVTAAITRATKQGLPPADAADITIGVAADLARGLYGSSYLQALAQKVVDRGGMPFGEAGQ